MVQELQLAACIDKQYFFQSTFASHFPFELWYKAEREDNTSIKDR